MYKYTYVHNEKNIIWCQLTKLHAVMMTKGGVGQWKSLFGALPRKTRFVKNLIFVYIQPGSIVYSDVYGDNIR